MKEGSSMIAVLPFPPSINHYWRKWNNRMVISHEGREYRRAICGLLAQTAGAGDEPPRSGRLALCMDAFPPDRRRRDLDNLQKPLLDALQHAGVYEDDSQIDLLLSRRRQRRDMGQVVVTVSDLPLRICPLCGHDLPPESSN
jgi:crossover junction endodeoxyribonuclease RusA